MLRQERQRYPVCVGAGLLEQTCADIREGKIHCMVWAAGGLGWEKVQGADSASGAPLTQQALLEACLEAQRKASPRDRVPRDSQGGHAASKGGATIS